MKEMILWIDHLVYVVPHLEKAMEELGKRLGASFTFGGQHPDKGTHNALLRIGPKIYLELLAIDPSNKSVKPPRWMGVDLIDQPQLTRWAIRSEQIERDCKLLQQINPQMGHIEEGRRKKADESFLTWKLSLPLASPKVELFPFYIDWQQSKHPAKGLPPDCQLIAFYARHPQPEKILAQLYALDIDLRVEQGSTISLNAVISGPSGDIIL